jgi:hypothetical protein
MKNPTWMLFALLLLAGCTTTVKYQAKTVAGPAKPPDYPIYIYTEKMDLPRPCEIIGTMHVGDTPFTVFGGSLEGVLNTLRQSARQKGADAVQLTSVRSPEFQTAHYRADANFLRFTEPWESVSFPEEDLRAYFRTNGATLDSVEGIWFGNDPVRTRIGIVKNKSKRGRDFVAFILNTKNPSWQRGDKKLDIARGERPGVYRAEYYQEDYQGIKVAFPLQVPPRNKFVIQTSEDNLPLLFTRE